MGMSIRARLILTFSLCLSLASAGISLIAFFTARQNSHDAFYALAESQLERVEERIQTFIEPGSMSVKYLAGLPLIKNSRDRLTSYLDTTETTTLHYANHSPYEQQIYDEFIRVHNSNGNFGLVFMANNDGQYAQAPEGHIKNAHYDPRLRPWYKEAINDEHEVTITSPYLTTGGGMVCSIMVKTRDMNGKALGLLGVDYSLQSLTRDLDARRILETGYLVIFDSGGRVIIDGHHPEYISMDPQDYPELRRRMAHSPDGIFTGRGDRNIEEYIVTHSMASTKWKIAVVFDRSELLKSSFSLLRTTLITSACILVLTIFIIIVIARRIVHPIEELIEASAIISSGEYEKSETIRLTLREKLKTTGEGESRKLSEALNSMINTLEDRVAAAVSANNAKSRFLANMSHEMRTPMNAIIGMTAIAKSSSDEGQKDHCLKKIEDASNHLLGVINDILDMSRIEANKFELSPVRFNFEKMIRKTVNMINFKVDEKKQDFHVHLDKNIPQMLIGDEQRLVQVITNLLSNAVKFTPDGGSVRLGVFLEEEAAAGEANTNAAVLTVRFEVADSGIGISGEQQSRLFRSFEQADSSTVRKYGGTGLGLAICRYIVQMMNGRIQVESEAGKGSVFSFTVQLARVRTPAAGGAEEIHSAGKGIPETVSFEGRKVLLAEDAAINREIVLTLLEPFNLHIDCAENGVEAVRRFSDAHGGYDLVFMDLQMPEMDGYEATRRIRDLEESWRREKTGGYEKPVPIIAMTANVFREDIERCLESGMNDHVGKPLDFEIVLEKLKQYL
jgi:signal transduction histidine kinase